MNLQRPIAPDPYKLLPRVPSFTLESTDVRQGTPVAEAHVYAAGNRSPQLAWRDPPKGTGSFVVTCFDPDAPSAVGLLALGGRWTCRCDGDRRSPTGCRDGRTATALPGKAPSTCRSDWGSMGLRRRLSRPRAGPGPHRYYFVVHAVDVETLGVDEKTSPAWSRSPFLGTSWSRDPRADVSGDLTRRHRAGRAHRAPRPVFSDRTHRQAAGRAPAGRSSPTPTY